MPGQIIAIDGPSGAGKSTVTRLVAERLGLRFLDTGAMYRAITLHCMRAGIKLDDVKAVAAAAAKAQLRCEPSLKGPMRVFLGAEEVTEKIRTVEVTRNIHYVADVREVRDLMVKMQRQIGEQGGLATEGRDQGTVVFPDASLKVYMYASAEVRSKRRVDELNARGQQVTLDEVLREINQRDMLDKSREIGGLKKAADAVELDTSDMTPEQAAETIIKLAKSRLAMRTRRIDKQGGGA
ncbi:CMP/dCMP kinase [Planctomycetaceae bacterium]|nr:CMP/dCMP kinase [Planctomycetaceae bacterium]